MLTSARARIATLVLLASVAAAPARADAVADFYQGKQVNFVVSFGPGGSYGLYAHLIATHIGKYLPGNPSIMMQYMPGGGGVKATNYMYNAAPKDGSVIATVFKDLALEQALRPKEAKYDARKFGWIGSVNEYISVITVWRDSGIKSIADARKREVAMATSGRAHQGSQLAILLNDFAGTKFKLVTGYRGAADMNLAMERGEVQARINSSLGLRTQQAAWVRDGKVISLAQGGEARQPDMPNVPLFSELVKDPEGRQVLAIVESGSVVGWPELMPPGVPADRLAAWRKAFDETMKDPAFIADVKKAKLDVHPKSGQVLAALIDRILAADPKIIARARKIAGIKE